MTAESPPRDLHSIPCKCCAGTATLCAGIDFNRSCEDRRGQVFAPAGVDIPYHRCAACGFAFTIAFDDLTPAQFAEHIYNDEYVRADPDFLEVRPANSARLIEQSFGHAAAQLRILDYGGGDGRLARALTGLGFPHVETWDPFYATDPPEGRFDLVTAFEVMEHSPTPRETLSQMLDFMAPGGMLFFSTLLQPEPAPRLEDWWYAAPRNGHVSLYTRPALRALADSLGVATGSDAGLMHVVFRERPPAWAASIFGSA